MLSSEDEDLESLFLDDELPLICSDTIYAALANLAGLYTFLPAKCIWSDESQSWQAESGDFDVVEEGSNKGVGSVAFASFDKQEVATWIAGVRAAMSLIRGWADSAISCTKCGARAAEDGKSICMFCKKNMEEDEN